MPERRSTEPVGCCIGMPVLALNNNVFNQQLLYRPEIVDMVAHIKYVV
jgi:hypothetical protein